MESNTGNGQLGANDQYKLAQLLLRKYDTFHPFLQMQMEYYVVACCMISLGGTVKMDASKKTIEYDIKTEKKFAKKGKGLPTPIKNNKKITDKKYKEQKQIAKLNLTEWTQHLLWGPETTVRVQIDGTELK
jgi:hypothetical protein